MEINTPVNINQDDSSIDNTNDDLKSQVSKSSFGSQSKFNVRGLRMMSKKPRVSNANDSMSVLSGAGEDEKTAALR